LDEINYYLEQEYSEENGYDIDIIPRITNKLVAFREILLGKVITSDELGISIFSGNLEFSIFDSILSMINIEIIKVLKKKIYSLKAMYGNDERFIDLLKQRLKLSKIQFLFNSSLSEMLSLYCNTGIDEIPSIELDKIQSKLNRYNNVEIKNSINNVLTIIANKCFNEIINTYKLDNNSQDVFHYLVTYTTIDVIIDYMDKDTLNKYYNYCCQMINEDNKASVEIVKRLLKGKSNN